MLSRSIMTLLPLLTQIKEGSAASCPTEPGWFQAGQSCYLVSHDPMSWYSGQEVCKFFIYVHFLSIQYENFGFLCHFLVFFSVLLGSSKLPGRNQIKRRRGSPRPIFDHWGYPVPLLVGNRLIVIANS